MFPTLGTNLTKDVQDYARDLTALMGEAAGVSEDPGQPLNSAGPVKS